MNWDYLIAGFFDGEGNLNIKPVKGGSGKIAYQFQIRIYSSETIILEKIQKFLNYGKIYFRKKTGVSELTISKKADTIKFLKNIVDKSVLKKDQINFILNNYSFERNNNVGFDLDIFRGFIKRKNVVRTHHTLFPTNL